MSLGCPKNTVDSERMLSLLRFDGYELVTGENLQEGQIVNCEIVTAREYDLIAAAI